MPSNYFNRFFSIGTGYESTSDFLAKDIYAEKFMKTMTNVKGHVPVRDNHKSRSSTDITSIPVVLHAPTRERLRLKQEKKNHRSEVFVVCVCAMCSWYACARCVRGVLVVVVCVHTMCS